MKNDLSIALSLTKAVNPKTAIGDSLREAWGDGEVSFGKSADYTDIYNILEEKP
jgi:hypothetical protein